MTHPSFAIVVTFRIKPDFVPPFLDRVRQQASDSLRLEEDCKQFDVLVDETDPCVIVLYETYRDAQAFDAHRETSHFSDFNATVGPWIATKEIRRLQLLEGI